jgi:hypothetical protein
MEQQQYSNKKCMAKSVSLHFLQIVQIYVSLPSAAQLWAGVFCTESLPILLAKLQYFTLIYHRWKGIDFRKKDN